MSLDYKNNNIYRESAAFWEPLMEIALEEAEFAYKEEEVPVGALLIDETSQVLARAHNRSIQLKDPVAHSEVLVLRKAGELRQNYRLPGCVLITTLEPCIMCMGALVQARISGLIFGCRDPKQGAALSKIEFFKEFSWLNHQFWIRTQVLEQSCKEILQRFFSLKR